MSNLDNNALINEYGKYFNKDRFLPKVGEIAEKAGKEVVSKALLLYYVMISSNDPISVSLTIAGALGYLVLPFDLIPDVVIGLGFTDDIAALCYVCDQVQSYRTPEIDRKVETKLNELFN